MSNTHTNTNTGTLAAANAALAKGDVEGFLTHCTDDTVWHFVGDRTFRGKEAVRGYLAEAYAEPPRFEIRQTIAEGAFVTALGEIALKDATGATANYAVCDVWRFEDGRMAELRAFVVRAG